MVKDKEHTMFSQGWKLGRDIKEITIDELQDTIIATLHSHQARGKKISKKPKSFVDVKDVDTIRSTGEGSSSKSSMRFVEPKKLEQEVQKAKKKDTGGMEK